MPPLLLPRNTFNVGFMEKSPQQHFRSGISESDESLVERALHGDAEAEAALYAIVREHARFLCRGGGPAGFDADWEDVAQVAGELLFSNGLQQFSGGAIRSFVYVIVKRTVIRMARAHRRRKQREEKAQPDKMATGPEYPQIDAGWVLARLSTQCRDLLIRVYLWDASYRDLAQVLGLQESSVRSRAARCVAQARKMTEAQES